VILDEEQEHSYKSENTPRYHAREVALWRGVKENALVLLGSATPSVESMFYAKSGVYKLYQLPQRFGGRKMPEVEIVDMRQELKLGNDLSMSNALQNAIRDTEQAGKQAIKFISFLLHLQKTLSLKQPIRNQRSCILISSWYRTHG
jgi:primosomal protein N' (replication factor Y)